jgi:hypothetical protein
MFDSTLSYFECAYQGYQIYDRNYHISTGIIPGIFLFLFLHFGKT